MKFWPLVLSNYLLSFGKIFCFLSLDSGSTVKFKLLNGIWCFIVTINIIGIQLSLLSTIHINFHDKILVTTLLAILVAFTECLINILFLRFKSAEFQELLQNFTNFLSTSKEHERVIINQYFKCYKHFYIFLFIFASGTTIVRVIFAPILNSSKIPFALYYPFAIEQYSAVHFIIYLSQSIASFYCGYQIIYAIITAMIFTHAVMKLKILVYDLKRVENYSQLKVWIQQHLECIRFVNQINEVFGIVILKSFFLLGLAIIFGSIKFIYNQDFFSTTRAFLQIVSCLTATYIYNGPADNLYEMNHEIRYALYDMKWNEELMEMKKAVIIIMTRLQKPIFISPLQGLMPALNRKIYTNFLSYLISYIMTLRAIVNTQ